MAQAPPLTPPPQRARRLGRGNGEDQGRTRESCHTRATRQGQYPDHFRRSFKVENATSTLRYTVRPGLTSKTSARQHHLTATVPDLGISTDISLNAARQVTVDAGLSKTDWGSRVPGCVGLAPRTGCNFRASWTPAGALERVEPPAGQVADELLALLDRHGPVRDLAPRGPASVPGVSTAGVGVVGRVTELVEVVVGYPAGGD